MMQMIELHYEVWPVFDITFNNFVSEDRIGIIIDPHRKIPSH